MRSPGRLASHGALELLEQQYIAEPNWCLSDVSSSQPVWRNPFHRSTQMWQSGRCGRSIYCSVVAPTSIARLSSTYVQIPDSDEFPLEMRDSRVLMLDYSGSIHISSCYQHADLGGFCHQSLS